MSEYKFDVYDVCERIANDWLDFLEKTKSTGVAIGISGGIDSTCCAALACRVFGKDNVYGISMANGTQHDISDVNLVFETLGMKRLSFNIEDVFNFIINGVENNAIDVSEQTRINLPPRIRMSVLYAFAQSLNAVVVNTCNRSETNVGYDTLFGDDCGSYAPIQDLTKTEVRKLAEVVGVDNRLICKKPEDGLQGMTDEDRFGFTYDVLDAYIRTGVADSDVAAKIMRMYNANRFKIDMIRISGPKFGYPDFVRGENV